MVRQLSIQWPTKRPSLKTTSKKEARRKAIRLEAEILEGRHEANGRAPSITSVIDAYRKHLQTEGRAAKTLNKYEFAFQLIKELAVERKAKSILQVDMSFIDAFRQRRAAGGSAPKTIHNDTVTLRQLVNFVLKRKMIHDDPLHGLQLKKPPLTPQPFWTLPQREKILAEAKQPQRDCLVLLADTGMRFGELQHLTWPDVDFQQRVIHIRPKEGWRPKTGDIRVVPITDRAYEVLSRLPKCHPWVVTARPSRHYPRGDHQISERRLLQYLKRIIYKLDLKGHLHTFRHTFISIALFQRTPESVVRKWVGNVDEEVWKMYVHVADQWSQAAMQRLERKNREDMSQSTKQDPREDADSASAQIQHNERNRKDEHDKK